MIAWLAAAWAEPPAPEPAAPVAEPTEPQPAAPEPAEPYEVVVYGELLVEQARAAVVERGDHVVYRHANAWYGEVLLYDDGWMQVKRQPLRVEGHEMPWAARNSPVAWAGCVLWPWLCLRSSGATYDARKWRSRETMTVDGLQPTVQAYGDRVADLATSRKVESLPDRLGALWERGEPLVPGPPLVSWEARRAALVAYWSDRTDTTWGREVQATVEAFCRAVVQRSDHPFTFDELDAVRATGPDRPFLP